MQASEVPVMRRVNRIVEGREQTGFWLPVDWVEAFPEEHLGESTLRIWMQYEAEYNRFLGSISLWQPYHVEAYQFITKDTDGGWHVADEDADQWIGTQVEGNKPNSFTIAGFEGEWILVISPYT